MFPIIIIIVILAILLLIFTFITTTKEAFYGGTGYSDGKGGNELGPVALDGYNPNQYNPFIATPSQQNNPNWNIGQTNWNSGNTNWNQYNQQQMNPWQNTTNNPLFPQPHADSSYNIIAANQTISYAPMNPPSTSNVLSFGQVPIPQTGIPYGYYQTGPNYMSQIPYGFIASPDKKSIIPQIQATIADVSSNNPSTLIPTNASNSFTNDSSNNITHYDPNNYNITFHQNPQDTSSNYFADVLLNKPSATYYQPGSYPYGPSSWVPKYEDSVYLSKLTGLSSTSPLYNTAAMKSGFCFQMQNDPQGLEEQCNKLDQNVCASTSCCVLLGSSKCVSGNQNGPIMKANYSDKFIGNREYYYYMGRCYGNCLD
jgi:hypothetical protein